jgi:hypothetical protein
VTTEISESKVSGRGIDSLIIASEGYLGKRVYICGNPNCGTLIIFHKDANRPILCKQSGEEIDWEGEYVRRIKICPKCNEEYEVNANYCSFHSPKVALQEKEIEKSLFLTYVLSQIYLKVGIENFRAFQKPHV